MTLSYKIIIFFIGKFNPLTIHDNLQENIEDQYDENFIENTDTRTVNKKNVKDQDDNPNINGKVIKDYDGIDVNKNNMNNNIMIVGIGIAIILLFIYFFRNKIFSIIYNNRDPNKNNGKMVKKPIIQISSATNNNGCGVVKGENTNSSNNSVGVVKGNKVDTSKVVDSSNNDAGVKVDTFRPANSSNNDGKIVKKPIIQTFSDTNSNSDGVVDNTNSSNNDGKIVEGDKVRKNSFLNLNKKSSAVVNGDNIDPNHGSNQIIQNPENINSSNNSVGVVKGNKVDTSKVVDSSNNDAGVVDNTNSSNNDAGVVDNTNSSNNDGIKVEGHKVDTSKVVDSINNSDGVVDNTNSSNNDGKIVKNPIIQTFSDTNSNSDGVVDNTNSSNNGDGIVKEDKVGKNSASNSSNKSGGVVKGDNINSSNNNGTNVEGHKVKTNSASNLSNKSSGVVKGNNTNLSNNDGTTVKGNKIKDNENLDDWMWPEGISKDIRFIEFNNNYLLKGIEKGNIPYCNSFTTPSEKNTNYQYNNIKIKIVKNATKMNDEFIDYVKTQIKKIDPRITKNITQKPKNEDYLYNLHLNNTFTYSDKKKDKRNKKYIPYVYKNDNQSINLLFELNTDNNELSILFVKKENDIHNIIGVPYLQSQDFINDYWNQYNIDDKIKPIINIDHHKKLLDSFSNTVYNNIKLFHQDDASFIFIGEGIPPLPQKF